MTSTAVGLDVREHSVCTEGYDISVSLGKRGRTSPLYIYSDSWAFLLTHKWSPESLRACLAGIVFLALTAPLTSPPDGGGE